MDEIRTKDVVCRSFNAGCLIRPDAKLRMFTLFQADDFTYGALTLG